MRRLSFEMALVYLKQGRKIRRAAWKQGWFSQVVSPEVNDGVSTRTCLFLEDVLALDWEVDDEALK
jgi:hypothetical protein